MIDYAVVILPTVIAVVAFIIKNNELRRKLIPLTAVIHSLLTLYLIFFPHVIDSECWIYFGTTGKLFLSLTSFLFLVTSFYTCNYLKEYHEDVLKGIHADNAGAENVFTACFLIFLSTITLVAGAQNIGLLWIGMEATTLASAPLIYFNRTRYSLEAAWKYLLICSVGIGLALLGNVFVEMSFHSAGADVSLFIRSLIVNAHSLDHVWLKTAFIFFLVGYGTKMGLAPMHTWLPDAHSEAPAMISALMSGVLLNCGFLGILRMHQVMCAAGVGDFSRELLMVFGLISLLFAAIFIVNQRDFKRMLAYSSIENMGIIAFAFGLGGTAVNGGFIQLINHSLTKGALFMLAGNIYLHYKTRRIQKVSGVLESLPVTGVLWMAGFIAISGIPPFGIFVSEFIIIKSAIASGNYIALIIFIILLIAIFAGMASIFIRTSFGHKPEDLCVDGNENSQQQAAANDLLNSGAVKKEKISSVLPPAILLTIVLVLGIYIPVWLSHVIRIVASYVNQKRNIP